MNKVISSVRQADWNLVMLGYLSFLFIMLITVLFARIIHAVATYPLSLAALEATPDPHDLTGRQILSTDLITCGEDSDSVMTWVNESDQTIYITKAQVWMGMYKGSISDFAVWVQRDGKYGARSSTLIHSNWDHYTDPVSPDHYIQMDYSPHYTSVEPGEVLALHSFCSNLEDSNAVGHATLTIWYYQ